MKAQDKVLMRQFLELRASIHGLRTDNLTPSSTVDLSATSRAVTVLHPATLDMPCGSLPWLRAGTSRGHEETHTLPRGHVVQRLRGDDCEVEFRARTVSMVPARPRSKLQSRTFSNELL